MMSTLALTSAGNISDKMEVESDHERSETGSVEVYSYEDEEDDEEYDEDEEYEEDEEYDSDNISSSPSIPDENIDFSLVYALHTFVATVEGQASVLKGDELMLLDDSNSYWWLVRVLKTHAVGYIPAENIETPWERLARLNKHRNVDLSNPTDKDVASGPTSARISTRRFVKRIPPSMQKDPHLSQHPINKGVSAPETHPDHPSNISPLRSRKDSESQNFVEFIAPIYYEYSADEWPYGDDYDAESFDDDNEDHDEYGEESDEDKVEASFEDEEANNTDNEDAYGGQADESINKPESSMQLSGSVEPRLDESQSQWVSTSDQSTDLRESSDVTKRSDLEEQMADAPEPDFSSPVIASRDEASDQLPGGSKHQLSESLSGMKPHDSHDRVNIHSKSGSTSAIAGQDTSMRTDADEKQVDVSSKSGRQSQPSNQEDEIHSEHEKLDTSSSVLDPFGKSSSRAGNASVNVQGGSDAFDGTIRPAEPLPNSGRPAQFPAWIPKLAGQNIPDGEQVSSKPAQTEEKPDARVSVGRPRESSTQRHLHHDSLTDMTGREFKLEPSVPSRRLESPVKNLKTNFDRADKLEQIRKPPGVSDTDKNTHSHDQLTTSSPPLAQTTRPWKDDSGFTGNHAVRQTSGSKLAQTQIQTEYHPASHSNQTQFHPYHPQYHQQTPSPRVQSQSVLTADAFGFDGPTHHYTTTPQIARWPGAPINNSSVPTTSETPPKGGSQGAPSGQDKKKGGFLNNLFKRGGKSKTKKKGQESAYMDSPPQGSPTSLSLSPNSHRHNQPLERRTSLMSHIMGNNRKHPASAIPEPSQGDEPGPSSGFWDDEALRQQEIEAQNVLHATYGVTRRQGRNDIDVRTEAERRILQEAADPDSFARDVQSPWKEPASNVHNQLETDHAEGTLAHKLPQSLVHNTSVSQTPESSSFRAKSQKANDSISASSSLSSIASNNKSFPRESSWRDTSVASTIRRNAVESPTRTLTPNGSSYNMSGSTVSPSKNRPGSLMVTGSDVPLLNVMRVFAGDTVSGSASFKTVLLNESTTTTDLIKQAVQRFQLTDAPLSDYTLSIKQIVEDQDRVLGPLEKPLIVFDALAAVSGAPVSIDMPNVRRSSISSISSFASIKPDAGAMSDFGDDSKVKFYLHRKSTSHLSSSTTTGQSSGSLSTRGKSMSSGETSSSSTDKDQLLFAVKIAIDKTNSTSPLSHVVIYIPQGTTVSELIELALARFNIHGVVDGGDGSSRLGSSNSPQGRQYNLYAHTSARDSHLNPRSRVIDAFRAMPVLRPSRVISNWERTEPERSSKATFDQGDLRPSDPLFTIRPAGSKKTVDELDAVKRKRASLNSQILVQQSNRTDLEPVWSIIQVNRDKVGKANNDLSKPLTELIFSTGASLKALTQTTSPRTFSYWYTHSPSATPVQVTAIIENNVPADSSPTVDRLRSLADVSLSSNLLQALQKALTYPEYKTLSSVRAPASHQRPRQYKFRPSQISSVDVALECVNAQSEYFAAVRRRQRLAAAKSTGQYVLPSPETIVKSWTEIPEKDRREAQLNDAITQPVNQLFERIPPADLPVTNPNSKEWYTERIHQLDVLEHTLDSLFKSIIKSN